MGGSLLESFIVFYRHLGTIILKNIVQRSLVEFSYYYTSDFGYLWSPRILWHICYRLKSDTGKWLLAKPKNLIQKLKDFFILLLRASYYSSFINSTCPEQKIRENHKPKLELLGTCFYAYASFILSTASCLLNPEALISMSPSIIHPCVDLCDFCILCVYIDSFISWLILRPLNSTGAFSPIL